MGSEKERLKAEMAGLFGRAGGLTSLSVCRWPGLGCSALVVEGEEPGENFFVRETGGPAVGGKDGLVQLTSGRSQATRICVGALVVEVGERQLRELLRRGVGWIEPVIALLHKFPRGFGDGFD